MEFFLKIEKQMILYWFTMVSRILLLNNIGLIILLFILVWFIWRSFVPIVQNSMVPLFSESRKEELA